MCLISKAAQNGSTCLYAVCAPPDLLAGFKGPTSKAREGGLGKEEERKGTGREERGRGRRERKRGEGGEPPLL